MVKKKRKVIVGIPVTVSESKIISVHFVSFRLPFCNRSYRNEAEVKIWGHVWVLDLSIIVMAVVLDRQRSLLKVRDLCDSSLVLAAILTNVPDEHMGSVGVQIVNVNVNCCCRRNKRVPVTMEKLTEHFEWLVVVVVYGVFTPLARDVRFVHVST